MVRSLLLETLAFFHEFSTGTLVVFLVFVVDLHEELRKRVEVPDAHFFLDTGNEFLVSRGKDTQSESGNTIGSWRYSSSQSYADRTPANGR